MGEKPFHRAPDVTSWFRNCLLGLYCKFISRSVLVVTLANLRKQLLSAAKSRQVGLWGVITAPCRKFWEDNGLPGIS